MVTVTDLAAEKLAEILAEEGHPEASLRVIVVPNGNGAQYMLSLEEGMSVFAAVSGRLSAIPASRRARCSHACTNESLNIPSEANLSSSSSKASRMDLSRSMT